MEFISRTEAPTSDNKFYTSLNTFYRSGYGGFEYENAGNCTWYAFGRAYELLGTEPQLGGWGIGHGNARTWWEGNMSRRSYPYGDHPALGAIAVFDGISRDSNGNTFGHVMVVEDVDNDVVTLSGSDGPVWLDNNRTVPNPSAKRFYIDTLTINELRDKSYHGGLIGFIYIGDFEKENTSMVTYDAAKLMVYSDFLEFFRRLPTEAELGNEIKLIQENNLTIEQYDGTFRGENEFREAYRNIATDNIFIGALDRHAEDEALKTYSNVDIFPRIRDVTKAVLGSPEFKSIHGYNITFDDEA